MRVSSIRRSMTMRGRCRGGREHERSAISWNHEWTRIHRERERKRARGAWRRELTYRYSASLRTLHLGRYSFVSISVHSSLS